MEKSINSKQEKQLKMGKKIEKSLARKSIEKKTKKLEQMPIRNDDEMLYGTNAPEKNKRHQM